MLIAYWIIAGLSALAFLAAGAMKLLRPKEQLRESGMAYTEDFSGPQVKLIGLAEVLGAIGLILPVLLVVVAYWSGWIGWVSTLAGVCLAVLMGGAVATHVRRREGFAVPLTLGLLALAAAVLAALPTA